VSHDGFCMIYYASWFKGHIIRTLFRPYLWNRKADSKTVQKDLMGPQDLSFDVEFVQIGQAVAEKHERIHFVTNTRTHTHIHTRLMQILKFLLHGAKTIPIWVLMILPKFELIWLESDTAQTLQSLYGNYYRETKFFVHCSLAFSHIALVKSSLAILMGNQLQLCRRPLFNKM